VRRWCCSINQHSWRHRTGPPLHLRLHWIWGRFRETCRCRWCVGVLAIVIVKLVDESHDRARHSQRIEEIAELRWQSVSWSGNLTSVVRVSGSAAASRAACSASGSLDILRSYSWRITRQVIRWNAYVGVLKFSARGRRGPQRRLNWAGNSVGSEDVGEKCYDPEDDRISDRHHEHFVIGHRRHCCCSVGSRPAGSYIECPVVITLTAMLWAAPMRRRPARLCAA